VYTSGDATAFRFLHRLILTPSYTYADLAYAGLAYTGLADTDRPISGFTNASVKKQP